MPGDRHGAVGGDVLPAIGQRTGDIGRTIGMPQIGARLKQVGAARAEIVRHAEIGAATGKCKASNGVRREQVVGTDCRARDAASGVVRSDSRIAVGRLRAAKAGRPHVPAVFERRSRRRLGEHRIGVGALVRRMRTRLTVFFGKCRCARRRVHTAPAPHERIGQQSHEHAHRIQGRLLRAGPDLARHLRQCG